MACSMNLDLLKKSVVSVRQDCVSSNEVHVLALGAQELSLSSGAQNALAQQGLWMEDKEVMMVGNQKLEAVTES